MRIPRIHLAIVFWVLAGQLGNANAQKVTTLYSFTGGADGYYPIGALVQGTDGNFYGATVVGGTDIVGTLFKISPTGTFRNFYSFSNSGGFSPEAGLIQGSDGNFYGTTIAGGTSNSGTVFKISPAGKFTSLHAFNGMDGATPQSALVQGSDGYLYGTTLYGGSSDLGTVFKISSAGVFSNLYSFSGPDGKLPETALVEGSDGNFYGTTTYGGGTNGAGTVFRISSNGSFTNLYIFDGSDGSNPLGLVQGSDSNFYGTTTYGGVSANCSAGCGTLFRISANGSFINLYSFDGSDGSAPWGLEQGSDGSFYGVTYLGGTKGGCYEGCGTVFKLDVGLGPISTNCTFSMNPINAVFDAAGGPGSIKVTASNGCAWTATNNDSFITITSGSSGSGNGTVHYTVAANTSSNEQVGTMTIAGQTFTVREAGAEACTFTLSKTNFTLAAKGGSKNVSVKVKGTDCSWTAMSNDPFITITSGANGTGTGKVYYTVPGNTNATALSGTMTIAGQTFTVNQAAGGCTFKLSPKTGKIKAAGGSATVRVKPNFNDCEWTAVGNDSFITITDGVSGVGKGTVSYTIPANTSTNVLTRTMTIAGETFTVTQAGAK